MKFVYIYRESFLTIIKIINCAGEQIPTLYNISCEQKWGKFPKVREISGTAKRINSIVRDRGGRLGLY